MTDAHSHRPETPTNGEYLSRLQIPTQMVALARLPLTDSGKIDRQALSGELAPPYDAMVMRGFCACVPLPRTVGWLGRLTGIAPEVPPVLYRVEKLAQVQGAGPAPRPRSVCRIS